MSDRFSSMIDKFLNREKFTYNIEEFDNIIKTKEIPDSFILYQEQMMKVLNYSGFEMSECYSLIKAIAKKRQGVIEPLKDRFIEGFINNQDAFTTRIFPLKENSTRVELFSDGKTAEVAADVWIIDDAKVKMNF